MFKVGDTVKTKCDGRVGVVTLVWSFGGSTMYDVRLPGRGGTRVLPHNHLERTCFHHKEEPKKEQSLSVFVDEDATTISANERLSSEKIKKILDIINQ